VPLRALLIAFVLTIPICPIQRGRAAVTPPQGFRTLFSGKDLSGWHGMPHFDPRKLAAMSDEERAEKLAAWMEELKAHWRVENGEVINDGKGPYLTTDEQFGDMELLIEYKTVAKADSGIYLRGTPQVQIWDYTQEGGKWNRGADRGSGGLFNNSNGAPGRIPLVRADAPFGQWNRFRIVQVGDRTSVWLNDKLVVDHAVMENYWDRSRLLFAKGPIQLQTHGGEIRWRNIFVREIPPDEATAILEAQDADGFEPVFDGKSFEGWTGAVENYEVKNGAIVCKPGKGGVIYTKEEYEDFVVRLEIKLPPAGNNGLAIRYPGAGRAAYDGMCELQVIDTEHPKYAKLDPRQSHGSAYAMVAAHRGYLRPTGQWNFQQVTVKGSTVKVELNGYTILDTDLSKVTEFLKNRPHPGKDLKSGHFGFAGHQDPVQFRNIRIKRLDSKTSGEPNAKAWPQFRGYNASGRAVSHAKLPTKIGPESRVVWKVALPPGHSSPVVFGDRIYVTAVRNEKLLTIGLDRKDGQILWEVEAPYETLELIHPIGSYAQSSPVTDGERVVSLFGSCGLFCYDTRGNLLWKKPMGPFNNGFGAGSSPIIVDDWIILSQDHDTDSFLAAIDKRTGRTVWKTDRSEFPRNYCTPVIWEVDGKKQIVVAATLRVVGYDFETGKELWTVRGLSRAVCSTPVVGEDNTLYVAGWASGGDEGDRIHVAPFDEVIEERDANKNGTLEEEELPENGPIQRRFPQVDRDKSGSVTKKEFEYYRNLFDTGRNVVLAVKPGGRGDVTGSHMLWEYRKFVPFCASPLYENGYLFAVKDGGILTSLNPRTGEPLQTKRVAGTGKYFCSPVAGDGKIYLLDQRGTLSVVSAWAEWKVLATADFGEDAYATPAIVDGRIYLRTTGHLFCFGNEGSQ